MKLPQCEIALFQSGDLHTTCVDFKSRLGVENHEFGQYCEVDLKVEHLFISITDNGKQ